ncbi:MAG: IgGFc-binding protein [Bacteroidetes bacterium]|nr:IgGFc-binding protein [Bacteroidota bacterium]
MYTMPTGMPGLTATDHLFEQMHPENMFGNEFTTTPLMLRDSGDTFRILAKEDSTIVQINGISLPSLNHNEHFETILTSASIISSNRPVCVAQYSNSLGFDYTTGDPFEMLLFPASYSYKKTYFKTYYNSPVSNFDFLINIITKSSSISTVFFGWGSNSGFCI